jgi:hypothetical protein
MTDIQDFYQSQEQSDLLNYFIDAKIGVTAAIIAKVFNGQDSLVYTALKRCITVGPGRCAIANRGWDNTPASSFFSISSAKTAILKADDKIRTYFPNYDVLTYIPYKDQWNSNMLNALKQLSYDAISASVYTAMLWNTAPTDGGLVTLPAQASLTYYNKDGLIRGTAISDIIDSCIALYNKGQTCVITTTSNDIHSGAYSISKLKALIAGLKSKGFTSTNFPDIITAAKGITSYPTFKPTKAVKVVTDSASTQPSKAVKTMTDPFVLFGIAFAVLLLSLAVWRCTGCTCFSSCFSKSESDYHLDGCPRSDSKDDLVTIEDGFTIELGGGGMGDSFHGRSQGGGGGGGSSGHGYSSSYGPKNYPPGTPRREKVERGIDIMGSAPASASASASMSYSYDENEKYVPSGQSFRTQQTHSLSRSQSRSRSHQSLSSIGAESLYTTAFQYDDAFTRPVSTNHFANRPLPSLPDDERFNHNI